MKKTIFAILACALVLGCAKDEQSTSATKSVASTAATAAATAAAQSVVGSSSPATKAIISQIAPGMDTTQMRQIIMAKASQIAKTNATQLSQAAINLDKAALSAQKAQIAKEASCISGNTSACIDAGAGLSGDDSMAFYQLACVLKDQSGCIKAAELFASQKAKQASPALGYLFDALCADGMNTCSLLK